MKLTNTVKVGINTINVPATASDFQKQGRDKQFVKLTKTVKVGINTTSVPATASDFQNADSTNANP